MLEVKEYFSKMAKAAKTTQPTLAAYLALQVLADCNLYAREMSRTLINTSRSFADERGNAVCEWNTPYAAAVYYTGKPRTEDNPNASLRWCDVARDRHGKAWRDILERAWTQMVLGDSHA